MSRPHGNPAHLEADAKSVSKQNLFRSALVSLEDLPTGSPQFTTDVHLMTKVMIALK